jgi:lipopolysaccharide transport system ATP-binding protein
VNKDSDTLIKVEGLSKKFCTNLNRSLIYGFNDMASALLMKSQNHQLRKHEFWALNDINFEVKIPNNIIDKISLKLQNSAQKKTFNNNILSELRTPNANMYYTKGGTFKPTGISLYSNSCCL